MIISRMSETSLSTNAFITILLFIFSGCNIDPYKCGLKVINPPFLQTTPSAVFFEPIGLSSDIMVKKTYDHIVDEMTAVLEKSGIKVLEHTADTVPDNQTAWKLTLRLEVNNNISGVAWVGEKPTNKSYRKPARNP